MKNLLIIMLMSFIGLNCAIAQNQETVIVFGNNEFYYSPTTKQIWFYKSESFETKRGGGIESVYGPRSKYTSLDSHWEEKTTFWEIDYENYAVLFFELPNNKNCDKVLLDSTMIWISYNDKEKNKISFDGAIVILEKIFEKWQYEVALVGPFYFPKKSRHFRKWSWPESQQKFGFFYPEDLLSWAEEEKRKGKHYIFNKDNEKIYRLPSFLNGHYLYFAINTTPIKQSFTSTEIYWDWREAGEYFHQWRLEEKTQKKAILKFLKNTEKYK